MIKIQAIQRLAIPIILILCSTWLAKGQKVVVGAARLAHYLPLLADKRIGVLTHTASRVGSTHLIDTLYKRNVSIVRIFSPEHGFFVKEAAGASVANNRTAGIPIVSLYGKRRIPVDSTIDDLEIMLVDLQDVGVRFYTYLSTLHHMMVACARLDVPVIVLDRPNPNGDYVDGPILEDSLQSFVGIHPIPIVHGMTLGELAHMINQEGWLGDGLRCDLQVIELQHWDHKTLYALPQAPSPNLRSALAVRLYPSLCLFEGTVLSVGRGTDTPFEVLGYPDPRMGKAQFKPTWDIERKHADTTCYGWRFTRPFKKKLAIKLWIKAYKSYAALVTSSDQAEEQEDFFNAYFDRLAGTSTLRKQIEQGFNAYKIRKSWKKSLRAFKKIRKKYLLYP